MEKSIVTSFITKDAVQGGGEATRSGGLVASSGLVMHKNTNGNLEIPTANGNPFLESTRFRQGTLYEIIFPIIGGFLFLYVLGVVVNKYKASRQAKVVEPFDKDYEFTDYTGPELRKNRGGHGEDELENPFSDRYESSNKSFTHKKNLSSVDFISQYRRSMDHLSGVTAAPPYSNHHADDSFTSLSLQQHPGLQHSKSQSIGSVLQLNFSQQPQLAPQSQSQNNSSDPDNSVFYSMLGTESPAAPNDSTKAETDSKENNTDKTSFYSIAEPTKAAKNATVNISYENGTSSNNPIMQNARNNVSVESHSMFEDTSFNNSYDIPESDYAVKHAVVRSPSPRRNNHVGMYAQSSSRSPTRSPVRSPNRGAFNNV
ncbi:hypothetical protein PICMEDRAFT_131094 [Pichia membranifaciens NRRL Y-2026]|uniref:Uncharacterized protein n=1 Tax=Pichia membranifaciens NRRL Y-2026 TaxID=763406 RepID=A0A1E3NK34_9ASCO|nr:hypothetical protein PICMEDRAFT_131094 [Pichia membranifaciens NRRL Y-2026]ODQ46504.1 hypothetical protein PICMEDRAFT_131094 [Pichia membranifaciens NRRL Y-2026]